jgi:broad specificity phosphatase PhoE
MDIFFIRHATSIGNKEHILQGQKDYDLSEEGIKEAMKLKIFLPKFDITYSSPLSRCIQTMEISTGLDSENDKVVIDDHLMEFDFGDLQGKRKDELTFEERSKYRKIARKNLSSNDHNGETLQDFGMRCIKIFSKIIEQAMKNDYNKILIFTHHGVIRAILEEYLKLSVDQVDNASIFGIRGDGINWFKLE